MITERDSRVMVLMLTAFTNTVAVTMGRLRRCLSGRA
jgi:hypothetical protein